MSIPCGTGGSCPYEYQCIKDQCLHTPVFPITGYPIAIYAFFPFASAICNTSGNSFGEFKVLLLMDALNYSQKAATTMCYPLILGTALFNFIRLIFERHPSKDTSLVDYNIVILLIPSVLYGSTIGSLVNNLIPPIVADVLIILILSAFSLKFFLKLRGLIQAENRGTATSQVKGELQQTYELPNASGLDLTKEPLLLVQREDSRNNSLSKIQAQDQKQQKSSSELEIHLAYQSSYHWQHILGVILLFGIFQTCSFLAQGKIVPFNFCTPWYPLGMSLLTVLYAGIVAASYFYTKRRMEYYRRIGYLYDYPLDQPKYFVLICLGAFLGGFNGGVFAIGNSTTMIFTLVYLEVEPMVVSATVGFQVVFAAGASLLEAIIQGTIPFPVIGFFFLLTFIGGGALSFVVAYFVRKMDRAKVNKIMVGIVACITSLSVISMGVNIGLGYLLFGPHYMIATKGLCG